MKHKVFYRSPFQLAIISGILIGCAFPPIPGVTAWFGFLPLIHIWQTQSPKESARWSFFAAVIANLISLYWIGLNSGASIPIVLVSMIAAILFPIIVILIYKTEYISLQVFSIIMSLLIIVTHKKNIGRLLRREEPKIGGNKT